MDVIMAAWDGYLRAIKQEYQESPGIFLRKPTISRCLHPNQGSVGKGYWQNVKGKYNIKDPAHGAPHICIDGMSSNSIQHIYYIDQMDYYWKNTKFDHILEIGGGYGNGCRIWKAYGHTGSYTICDFKEMNFIQSQYLEKVSDLNNVSFAQLDNCYFKRPNSLLQAAFSINEMPLETRALIEPHYRDYDNIFIVHNRKFDGIDNIEYFKNLKEELSDEYNVQHFPCPIYGLAWFFIAKRK